MNPVLWEPSQERREASLLWHFMQSVPAKLETYADIHRWSLDEMEAFWAHFWELSGLRASRGYDTGLAEPAMPGARRRPITRSSSMAPTPIRRTVPTMRTGSVPKSSARRRSSRR